MQSIIWVVKSLIAGQDVYWNGLNPFREPKKKVISIQELKEEREKNDDLRKIVIPELELLYSQVAGTNFHGSLF
jgi:transcriptional regulator of acetoin/glycerol metabolism